MERKYVTMPYIASKGLILTPDLVKLMTEGLTYCTTDREPILLTQIDSAIEENIKRVKRNLCMNKSCRIVRVNEIVKNKVVEVEFADGDIQKSVCQEPDVFSLDMAIAICICKHLLGGTKAFNDAVRKGVKIYKHCLEEAKRVEEEKAAEKRRREKRIERKLRRKAAAREAQIEIQKEAYLRAMKEKELEQAATI